MNPLELAGRALEAGRAGDGMQATVTAERSVLLRFAQSRPTQATAVDDLTVEITAIRNGQVGGAATNETDPESLAACARAAEAAAEAAARNGGPGTYPGLPDPRPIRAPTGYDADTARVDPSAGGAALGAAFEVAKQGGVEAHGIWTVGEVETAIASSAGIAVSETVTDAFMKVICIAPDGRSGYASATGVSQAAIDARALAKRAVTKARLAGEPAALPPGDYPAVLEPGAVRELLSMLGWYTFNGLAYAEDRSAFCGRLGSRVAAPWINLSDSPRFRRTLPHGFDAEGVPKKPLPLIQDGIAHSVVHDTRSAAVAGATTTGHAAAPGGSPFGPVPTNLVLLGGGEHDEADLCRPLRRGVYVTRLWYVNSVRPKETLVTGVTRDGTFLIEDGQVTRPLADLRFTDTALGLLERTEALGHTSVLASDGEFYGRRFASGVVCPPLRVSAMRFTG